MRNVIKNIVKVLGFVFLLSGLLSCGSQKDTVASRGMQNLTARYNILYNARELLNESQRNIEIAYQDNFENFIPVFKEPDEKLSEPELKKLDEVILKANTIVNEKFQSKYVDDAYFLIAEANHLKSNFYNAIEYFTYVYNSFPKEKELRQASLAYKIRSLISADRMEEAKSTLDSAFKYINTEKKSVADLNAIKAQIQIYSREDGEAITSLEKAIKLTKEKNEKIRWTFLLAQLQENAGKNEAAQTNYSKVIKSNAPFDMAFNALLNKISIENERNGKKIDRAGQLNSLLKDDKNRDFLDQIYYEIANSYAEKDNLEKAIENYNKGLRQNSRNQNQRGLTYLKLADLYLKNSEFIQAKNYYDSTLNSLSPQNLNYPLVQKKASNLILLSSRLQVIAMEDTLQMLAGLPEAERKARIGILSRRQAEKALQQSAPGQEATFYSNTEPFQNSRDSKFYFNNVTALSQGFSDFKKRWGNRKLEDNWRRGQRSASDLANAIQDNNVSASMVPNNPDELTPTVQTTNGNPFDNIPLTTEQKNASDQRIAAAYYDIGNYYRDILTEPGNAIKNYETLINRYPESELNLPVYYNLYRMYAESDPAKSLKYKDLILKKYPETSFAKIIKDPNYNQKSDAQEQALQKAYNETYTAYESKDYAEVIRKASEAETAFGQNNLSAQFAYLKALAIGHTQKLAALDTAFQQIVRRFPDDKLIVPLVKEHLIYLDENQNMMNKRVFALVDEDPNQPRFVEEPRTENGVTLTLAKNPPANPENTNNPAKEVIATNDPDANNGALKPVAETVNESGFTGFADADEYYFVVNVLDPSVNLSSSRFGIGQFNRTNFAPNSIKHQLKAVNNQNQLIFVGAFLSKDAVVDYYKNINPLLKEIMKIPAEKYSTFFISKKNLDQLNSREKVNQYIEFYQKNF
ncbi:MAG: tetratricopeptide repeat protein [Daejeonella sp.]